MKRSSSLDAQSPFSWEYSSICLRTQPCLDLCTELQTLKMAAGVLPLLRQLAVLLSVCGAEAEQRLQAVPVGLHVLIVHVNVVQIFLLLEDLLGRT